MRPHHDAARRTHVGAQVVVQRRGNPLLAQEREIVCVEIVADKDMASLALKGLLADNAITAAEADNAIAASAEGYSFPTNLDRDPPKGGMAPKTQQDLMRQALKENWEPEVFVNEAEAQAWRKLT